MDFISFITQWENIFFAMLATFTGIYLITLSNKKPVFSLNVSEAISIINNKNAIIIDLRTNSEFEKYHIAQSEHISPVEALNLKKINKDKYIITIGMNDKLAREFVINSRKKGFVNTFYLLDGINSWINNDMPVIKLNK